MKILILGLLAFLGWSAFSTHIWVCNVKGLCSDKTIDKIEGLNYTYVFNADSVKLSLIPVKPLTPGKLTVYFEFDKSEFKADASSDRYLDSVNVYIKNNKGASMSITGYTDAVGSEEYNQNLGYTRAQTLQHYFTINGIGREKIMLASRGEKDPAGDNNTAEGRADNRRTVITIKN